jgi:hypothetical protein
MDRVLEMGFHIHSIFWWTEWRKCGVKEGSMKTKITE